MAGNLAAMNNYLANVIGITEQPVRDALNAQGLDAFDVLDGLTDKDMQKICENCRSPGGTIPNPAIAAAANAVDAAAVTPREVPNRGVTLGFVYEKRLRQLRYFKHYLTKIQREFTANFASLARLNNAWKLFEKEKEDEEVEVEEPAKFKKHEDAREVLETIDNYLAVKTGANKIPLSYVTRLVVDLPEDTPGEEDPGYNLPDVSTELVRRASHDTPEYQLDNKAVWELLRKVMYGGPGWNWIKTYKNTMNGRAAYHAAMSHYFGESYQSKLKTAADNTLDTAFFDGKARNFTFEKYCDRLTSAFADLEQTGEGKTTAGKIRILLKGIVDPSLQHAKDTVLATANLKNDYEAAINFISAFADAKESNKPNTNRNLSEVSRYNERGGGRGRGRGGRGGRGGGGRGRGRGRGRGGRNGGRSAFDSSNPGKYYSPKEWMTMSFDEQKRAREAREAKDQEGKRKIAELETRISEMEASKKNKNDDKDESDSTGNQMNRRAKK